MKQQNLVKDMGKPENRTSRLENATLFSKRSRRCHREKISMASGMRQLPGTLRFQLVRESHTSGLTPAAHLWVAGEARAKRIWSWRHCSTVRRYERLPVRRRTKFLTPLHAMCHDDCRSAGDSGEKYHARGCCACGKLSSDRVGIRGDAPAFDFVVRRWRRSQMLPEILHIS